MNVVVLSVIRNIEKKRSLFKTLSENSGYNYTHIVIDNGSTDNSVLKIKKLGLTVLSIKKNINYFDALKIGIKYAIENKKADLIIDYYYNVRLQQKSTIRKIVNFYKAGCKSYILSPDIESKKTKNKSYGTSKTRGELLENVNKLEMGVVCIPKEHAISVLNSFNISDTDSFNNIFIKKGLSIAYFKSLKIKI